MKVQLERRFPIPASPAKTWGVLADIATVASCMPGARITEKVDDTHYKGTVGVKLGPASLSFRGQIEVLECDASTRTLKLSAKGTDTTGASFATMDLTARVEAEDDGTSALVGASEATVGGKAAAFGGRMMDAVSDQILKQFGTNFTAKVAGSTDAAADPGAARAGEANASDAGSPAARSADAAEGRTVTATDATVEAPMNVAAVASAPARTSAVPGEPPHDASPDVASSAVLRGAADGAASTPRPTSSPTPSTTASAGSLPSAEAAQLNGLALLWAVFVDWVRGLFGKKNAR